jgi:hypothetical protein
MKRCIRLLLAIVAFSVATFAADSPFSGTWKLKPIEGDATGRTSTAQVEADREHFKLNQQFVNEKGKSSKISFDAKFDRKDYPVSGDEGSDSVSIQRMSDRELKLTYKKAGKVTAISDVKISTNGKTATVTSVDYKNGEPGQNSTAVYEKQ